MPSVLNQANFEKMLELKKKSKFKSYKTAQKKLSFDSQILQMIF